LTGWIVDPGVAHSRRRATVVVNDVPVCVVEACVDRPDVQHQFGAVGPTGVLAELPTKCRPGDVIALVDGSGSELARLVVPESVKEEPEAVTDAVHLPAMLLERYRHDHNGDFLLLRGTGFRVTRQQYGPFAPAASLEPRRSKLTQQLDVIAMSRPADERIGGWLEEVDRAVAEVGHRYRRGWLLLGEDDIVRATAPDEAQVGRDRPPLTVWQRARLNRTGHRPPATDDELALFLTGVAVDLRSVGNGLSLLTQEQLDWLTEVVDPWHRWPITRYMAARRAVVPHWRDHFGGDDELSRAGLLCEAFVDEMCNGFGWTFFGSVAGSPEVLDALSAAVLSFAENGWPETPVLVGQADILEFRQSVNSDHPLAVLRPSQVRPAPVSKAPSHALIGLVGHGSAVGHNATLSEWALEELDRNGPVISLDHSSPEVGTELLRAGKSPSDWVLLHSQPDFVPSIMANGWPYLSNTDTVIGYMAWESTKVPESLHPGVSMVDEIWTPSEFSAVGLRTATSSPVHVVRHAFLPDEAEALLSQRRPPSDNGPFVVMSIVDAHSGLRRKNLSGMLAAFDLAFDGDPNYRMVLRIRNFSHITQQARMGDQHAHEVLAQIARSRNVDVVSGEMTRQQVLSLYERAHCYLSLHRSEGFGYTMAEAMMAGVPVVATGYSGNLEYMDADTALLVDYEPTSIRPGDYLFWGTGMEWAEPSVEHASVLLQSVAADPYGSQARADRAREFAADRLSFDRLVHRFKELLDGR
jgi:glycosyltransferase involved in cell wall biosynthesis